MAAIFGVLGSVSPAELGEMADRLGHRGLYALCTETERDVFLGLISNQQGSIDRVVIDMGEAHASAMSPEHAVQLYQDAGLNALERLRVPFALAAWNRTSQELILARDFIGIKPLYFTVLEGGGIAFASEYKALLAIERVPAVADLDAVQYLQTAKATPKDGRTLIKGIVSVAPGTIVRFQRNGEFRTEQLSATISLDVQERSSSRASDRLIKLLNNAVRPLVQDRAEVGVSLSGGIDSLAVAHLVRNSNPDVRIVGFTTGQTLDDHDVRVARMAMERLNGEHVPIMVEPEVLGARLPEAVWHLENPIGRSETVHFLELGRVARARGFDWLFSGMGADGIFAGMPRHKVLWLSQMAGPLRADLLQFFEATQTGQTPTRLLARLLSHLYFKGDVPSVPTVRHATDSVGPDVFVRPGPEFLNRALLDSEPEHTAYSLPRIERTLQASGVDYVSPFLDRNVIDFAFTLPSHMKIRRGREKYILREAMRRLISDDLRKVPKGLMRFQQGDRFTSTLQGLADTYLSAERVRKRGFFDLAQIEHIRKRCSGATPHPEASMRLWTLIATEVWAEQYLDNRGRRPLSYRSDLDPSSRLMITSGRTSRGNDRETSVAAAMTPSSAMSAP
jgi:asparagine synthase (glutamine-hydrolysing)